MSLPAIDADQRALCWLTKERRTLNTPCTAQQLTALSGRWSGWDLKQTLNWQRWQVAARTDTRERHTFECDLIKDENDCFQIESINMQLPQLPLHILKRHILKTHSPVFIQIHDRVLNVFNIIDLKHEPTANTCALRSKHLTTALTFPILKWFCAFSVRIKVASTSAWVVRQLSEGCVEEGRDRIKTDNTGPQLHWDHVPRRTSIANNLI